jgi:hypothetical protein
MLLPVAVAALDVTVETTEDVAVATTVEVPPLIALALKLSKVLAPVAGALTAKTMPC